MLIIKRRAYARTGLVGNPSDGYNGRTISIIVRNLFAEVVLYEWDTIEIVQTGEDQSRFRSIEELAHDVELHGYYGGIRLVKATIRAFFLYCQQKKFVLHGRNFSIRYHSTIPRQVGLAGSSAIIVATFRCLMEFYGVAIEREVLPSLVLSVETKELGIPAGLQDRVIQVYEGLVSMNFAKDVMRNIDGFDCGVYEPLDPKLLPPLYVAFRADVAEPTEKPHRSIRDRFQQGDPEVVGAMKKFAELALAGREALLAGDDVRFGAIMNENFDTRLAMFGALPAKQVEMIRLARSTGASAKFAGSGGAIVGSYLDASTLNRLRIALEAVNCRVFVPAVT